MKDQHHPNRFIDSLNYLARQCFRVCAVTGSTPRFDAGLAQELREKIYGRCNQSPVQSSPDTRADHAQQSATR